MYLACKQCIQGYDSDQLGPLQTYPHIFEKGDYFLFSQKKYASACSVLKSISPVHMKTLKR